jgi:hypothetical protein
MRASRASIFLSVAGCLEAGRVAFGWAKTNVGLIKKRQIKIPVRAVLNEVRIASPLKNKGQGAPCPFNLSNTILESESRLQLDDPTG